MTLRARPILAIMLMLSVTACSRPSEQAIRHALAQAWDRDPIAMEVDAGLIAAADAQGFRALQKSTRLATDATRRYAGDAIGDTVSDAIGTVSEISNDLLGGNRHSEPQRIALISGRNWEVEALDIKEGQMLENDFIARVRYDVSAIVGGERRVVARSISHAVRLGYHDGKWTVMR